MLCLNVLELKYRWKKIKGSYRTRVILEAEKMIEVVLLSRLHDRSIVHCFGDKILLARGGHRKAFACPA
jgi:hypothetical protein